MRQADQHTIDHFGLPGFTLMETAGREAARIMTQRYGPWAGKHVLVLCGKGNNGGDGLVVARVLYGLGAQVRVVSPTPEDQTTPDAAHNLRLLRQLADAEASDRLHLEPFPATGRLSTASPPDLIVDALLGTGLTQALRAPLDALVDWMNAQPAPVVALDVPTGVDSDTGRVHGTAVRAQATITMAAGKVGLYLNAGRAHAGQVYPVEIGIPAFVLAEAAQQPGCAYLADDALIRSWLPVRDADAHKYSVGMALALVGARGYTGAAVMACRAAARIGAGYVICAAPRSLQPALGAHLVDVATLALPETDAGTAHPDALDTLAAPLKKATALLVGCGLGRHPETQALVRTLFTQTDLPGVLDADGLHALAGHTNLLAAQQTCRWILTPHWGEFKHLLGAEAEGLDVRDRVALAGTYAQRWHCVLVLKGMPSVVGCPDGRVFINATGNPALATAGAGDALAGMCAGLLAQGLAPEQAAIAALHIGGAAADAYAAEYDGRTMLATDLADRLPAVLHHRFQPHTA